MLENTRYLSASLSRITYTVRSNIGKQPFDKTHMSVKKKPKFSQAQHV
jgi:hypothetical protein